MKRQLFATLILLIIGHIIYGQQIQWKRNLEESIKNRQSNGKDIIIYFGANWCGPCKRIEQRIFTDSKFIQFTKSFEMIKIYDDFNKEDKESFQYYDKIKKQFKVLAIPTFILLKKDNRQYILAGSIDSGDDFIKQIRSYR